MDIGLSVTGPFTLCVRATSAPSQVTCLTVPTLWFLNLLPAPQMLVSIQIGGSQSYNSSSGPIPYSFMVKHLHPLKPSVFPQQGRGVLKQSKCNFGQFRWPALYRCSLPNQWLLLCTWIGTGNINNERVMPNKHILICNRTGIISE